MITIRGARISKGWSQDRLGVEAGDIAQNRISQIERGAGVPPKLKEAEAISKALGYPMGEMFPQYAAHETKPALIREKTLHVIKCMDRFIQTVAKCNEAMNREQGGPS